MDDEKSGYSADYESKIETDVTSAGIQIDFEWEDEEDVGRTAMQRLAWRRLLRENDFEDVSYNKVNIDGSWVYGEFDNFFQ